MVCSGAGKAEGTILSSFVRYNSWTDQNHSCQRQGGPTVWDELLQSRYVASLLTWLGKPLLVFEMRHLYYGSNDNMGFWASGHGVLARLQLFIVLGVVGIAAHAD